MNKTGIYNYTTRQRKSYSELTRHTATLTTVLLQSHRRLPQAFTQNPRKRKRSRDFPEARRSFARPLLESLRRGALGSCLHVDASLVRVARGSDPRLPVTRLLRDSVHHATLTSTQPRDSSEQSPRTTLSLDSPCKLSQASHLVRPKTLPESSLASHLVRTKLSLKTLRPATLSAHNSP